ncbi:MAG: hypothetical protein II956_13085 [Bacteroidales bacterium]|nr:hypothetical protein [Bacteroidales bacterium]
MNANMMELRAELFSVLTPMLDDATALDRIISFLKSFTIKKASEKIVCDTDDEIRENLRSAFKEFKDYQDGKVKTRDFFEVVNEL